MAKSPTLSITVGWIGGLLGFHPSSLWAKTVIRPQQATQKDKTTIHSPYEQYRAPSLHLVHADGRGSWGSNLLYNVLLTRVRSWPNIDT